MAANETAPDFQRRLMDSVQILGAVTEKLGGDIRLDEAVEALRLAIDNELQARLLLLAIQPAKEQAPRVRGSA